jgi:polar amino acid transport system substrate-binding protein
MVLTIFLPGNSGAPGDAPDGLPLGEPAWRTREVPVRNRRTRKLCATGALSLMIVLAGAGCGSGGSTNTGAAPPAGPSGKVGAIAAQVPSAVRSKGTLTVAADATYAPNEFIGPDGHTVVGMDADLATAIGQVLGLKVNMVNATFDTIIPGLVSGKYDLGMSSFTDTKARQQTVDFVTYFLAGTSFYTKADGPGIASLAGLGGHKVAVEKGTTQAADAQAQAARYQSAGNPVTVEIFNDQNAVNLALSSGRADVAMADSPVAAYQVKQSSGTFKLSGKEYGTAPYGIAIPKNNGMAKPILAAVDHLMADGTYMKILDKWGIQGGAISDPKINGATS